MLFAGQVKSENNEWFVPTFGIIACSLAQPNTSWTSTATGDSSSHRHAALWVLFAAWPKGALGQALLYFRDQNEFLSEG